MVNPNVPLASLPHILNALIFFLFIFFPPNNSVTNSHFTFELVVLHCPVSIFLLLHFLPLKDILFSP